VVVFLGKRAGDVRERDEPGRLQGYSLGNARLHIGRLDYLEHLQLALYSVASQLL
jgi:hypothetical protein